MFIKIITSIFLCLFTLSVNVQAKESQKETTIYTMSASTRYCFANIYINDLEVISLRRATSASTGFTVGEYLKPKNNILKVEVWDPESEPGQWREDAKCTVYISAADPVRKIGREVVTKINFYPPNKPDLTKPEDLFSDIDVIDTTLGKSLTPPAISYSPETGHYSITRKFDVREGYIEWSWTRSPSLTNPLPIEQMKKLQEAYQRVWQILSKKDSSAMKKVFHEMMYESAMANNSTEESYYESADLEEYFDAEFLKDYVLMPLDFKNKQLKFALDNKVVHFSPTPLLFCSKKQIAGKKEVDDCYTLDSRFRFDGKEFVISR